LNQENVTKELFLNWQGKVTGPHTLSEIKNLLSLGKIHSLYKIQVDGQWVLLRDHLASLDKIAQNETASKQAASLLQPVAHQSALRTAIAIPEDYSQPDNVDSYQEIQNLDEETPVPTGIAITSFILSLFFFVPFLNLITWLMSLILGHLALSGGGSSTKSKAAIFAWLGLWISYVQIGYTLINLVWFFGTDMMPMSMLYMIIHAQMLTNSIGALIGASILMLAVKLTTGKLIRFSVCYVGALLPSAVSVLCGFLLQVKVNNSTLNESTSYLILGLLALVLFVGQVFFWSRFIRLPNDEEIGLPRAAIASVICTIVNILVVLAYGLLMAILIS
jgi:hypothetical protein